MKSAEQLSGRFRGIHNKNHRALRPGVGVALKEGPLVVKQSLGKALVLLPVHVASWKIRPVVKRSPERMRLTPWRILTR